jgi:hypothetical protein
MENIMRTKTNTSGSKRHPTFRDIIEETRGLAAEFVWQRAQLASRLRHTCADRGLYRQARQLGAIKERAVLRVCSILPEQIQVTVDHDWRRGYLSFRWPNHGGLHLPPGSAAAQLQIKRFMSAST